MAASLDQIYAAMLALNQVSGQLVTLLGGSSSTLNMNLSGITTAISHLPSTVGTSGSAPATPGSIVFSSSLAQIFILMQTSSGATVKVPAYSNP